MRAPSIPKARGPGGSEKEDVHLFQGPRAGITANSLQAEVSAAEDFARLAPEAQHDLGKLARA